MRVLYSGSFYIAVTQDIKALSGLLVYSLTSLLLGGLVQYGLHSRRRWLLLPHMIFLALMMIPVLLSVLLFGFSPLVYLILLPWLCILALVRFLSWRCLGNLIFSLSSGP